ncbi:hypothetical protein OQ279_17115 [Salinimicrobium sp. MT39]|uniref:Uncharacterized protein n=1 Tax=Salinimicrobium profundisediminis TaxID=2994553 RepID=A0A9X3CZZ4_9FLAO|nr:hypothetical protein [Cytobacillus gottheilii]MCX2839848.1 hypothetical protein [Salinimicrobium profundisediminis]
MFLVRNSFVLILMFLLIGCNGIQENETGYLTKEQVLKENPKADYFELNDKVYVTGIDWIEGVKLTKGEVIGEIKDGMASELSVGTQIIAPRERRDILIV